MSPIIDPGLPEGHPRQMYHHNLMASESCTWYSEQVGLRELLKYVMTNLGITLDDLLFNESGSVITKDQTVMLTPVFSERGPAVTVWEFGAAAPRVNAFIEREWNSFLDELSRGEWTGRINRLGLDHGVAQEHVFTGNPKGFDYINGSDVVAFFDAISFDTAEPPDMTPD